MPKNTPKTGMAQESSAIEQAISRALRDNLERIQRTSEELHHAVGDVVAACSSNKPANALPSLLRAQTSAASLAAMASMYPAKLLAQFSVAIVLGVFAGLFKRRILFLLVVIPLLYVVALVILILHGEA